MHLAGEAFDVLTKRQNVSDEMRDSIPALNEPDSFPYWRTVVRIAALCHDLGHLPFSHAAEHETLPESYTHERLSADLIQSAELSELLDKMVPPVKPDIVAKLAVGAKESWLKQSFDVWEAILTEIITGNAFGVDRMDYLLRDSLHAGVQYGKFDHSRLVQSLRLLPQAPTGDEDDDPSSEPTIGVDHGGIFAAEALLQARYHMFGQLYFHRVRVAYDLHLVDFLKAWLPGGMFSIDPKDHLNMTDNEVWVAIREASLDPGKPGHESADRIWNRKHFKVLYESSPTDVSIVSDPGTVIAAWAESEYGPDAVRSKHPLKSGGTVDFPVLMNSGAIDSSVQVSETIKRLPSNSTYLVFIDPEIRNTATKKLTKELVSELLSDAAQKQAEEQDDATASMDIQTLDEGK
jgi:HD superfamily phosphohydrolase